jgi:hypothetical protein
LFCAQIIAARNANLTLMSLLIDIGGFSVNVRECIRHYTPLHEAVRHNVVASAKFLLDRGADTALISVSPMSRSLAAMRGELRSPRRGFFKEAASPHCLFSGREGGRAGPPAWLPKYPLC